MKILKEIVYRLRGEYTTEKLVRMGMKLGKNFGRLNGVILDPSHCWLISIGDNVTMAPRVHILCHDASTKQFLGYTKIGRVNIGDNVFIGAESVVLPNVTIGNNVVIGANSTVTQDIPDNSVAAGTPAKVICSLEEYLDKNRRLMSNARVYGEDYTLRGNVTEGKKQQMIQELEGRGGTLISMEGKEPKISIIVPAYNIEEYIERCLKSISAQTYKNLQVIVVDDGSADKTGQIADQTAERDSRFVVIHKTNGGVSAARKTGLEEAEGEYVGFVDGDDYIEPEMYEKLAEMAGRYNADIAHCGYQMVFPDRVDVYHGTGQLKVQDTHTGLKDLLEGSLVEPGLTNKLYRKELFNGIEYDDSIVINEDLLFNYFLFQKSRSSVFLDKPYYHYMVRKNSATTSEWNEHKLLDPVRVLEIMRNKEQNQELKSLIQNRYVYQMVRVLIYDSEINKRFLREIQKKMSYRLSEEYKTMDKNGLSRKNYWMGKTVLIWTWGLKKLHQLHARISGADRKYKV